MLLIARLQQFVVWPPGSTTFWPGTADVELQLAAASGRYKRENLGLDLFGCCVPTGCNQALHLSCRARTTVPVASACFCVLGSTVIERGVFCIIPVQAVYLGVAGWRQGLWTEWSMQDAFPAGVAGHMLS